MQIRHMIATFGKLHHSVLDLHPGLNIIYAPNESGKSTWCQFLRTMFYGFPRRERGPMADKNRFAPWSGTPMSGSIEVIQNGHSYTVTRTTEHANAPMGTFSCTYTNTADAVLGIDSQNCGEQLLGVERSVFSRSAFISQSGLAIDKDAELERRIASLITTGEESTSFTDIYDCLKKQRNQRKHNKTGLIPSLENEISHLDEDLAQYDGITAQYTAAKTQVQQISQQISDLQNVQSQYEEISRQEAVRNYMKAQAQADALHDVCMRLQEQNRTLPSENELSKLLGMADALERSINEHNAAYEESHRLRREADDAQNTLQQHPFYPAREEDLTNSPSPASSFFSPLRLLISIIAGTVTGVLTWFASLHIGTSILIALATCITLYMVLFAVRRSSHSQSERLHPRHKEDIDAYLHLIQQARTSEENAQSSYATAVRLHHSCQDSMLLLLSKVQLFQPKAMDLTTSRTAIHDALQSWQNLRDAEEKARSADFQMQLIHSKLPKGPLPSWDAKLPQPMIPKAQADKALELAISRKQAVQGQLERLTGQLSTLGQRQSLQQHRDQCETKRQKLQKEYDALTLAMSAMEDAHMTLQSRFSPALGARAAEIFSQLTGGRYDHVLLNRDFSLSAQAPGDMVSRSIQLLSQGTADQLYLAVRLAICDLVLPENKAVPLILDDALCSFDDTRMALALDYLTCLSQTRQILLFTCQKREIDHLKNKENVTILSL